MALSPSLCLAVVAAKNAESNVEVIVLDQIDSGNDSIERHLRILDCYAGIEIILGIKRPKRSWEL